MIGIINYGLGNIGSFCNIYRSLSIDHIVIDSPSDLSKVTHIILPGVGAFDSAIRKLEVTGFLESLDKYVCSYSIPILGVCLGMQVMANSSSEGKLAGFGWINSSVLSFKDNRNLTLPSVHMGWNTVNLGIESPLFKGITDFYFYFLHSYYFPSFSPPMMTTFYGLNFTSGFIHHNIIGLQFHPEKSHSSGIKILRNFSSFEPC